jgi:hypothetical protein
MELATSLFMATERRVHHLLRGTEYEWVSILATA